MERLVLKLANIRKNKFLFELVIQEERDFFSLLEEDLMTNQETSGTGTLNKYGNKDITAIILICLLKGAEVVDYNCIGEKVENIAQAVYTEAKSYAKEII